MKAALLRFLLILIPFALHNNLYAQGGTCATAAANPISLPFTGSNLTNCGAGNNYTSANSTVCGSTLYLGGEEMLYAFTPTASGIVTVNLTSTSSWVGLMVYQGCPTGGTCVGSSSSSAGSQALSVNVTAGTTYYVMVDSWPTPNCHPSYNLNISAPGVGPTPTAQDCQGAIPVCQTTYSTTTSYSGTGNYPNEINSSNSCLGSGELNSVWYIFTVQQAGNLCFTITPNTASNDYDWALFNLTNANCSDIANNPSLEVSCNYSGVSGATGANGNGGSQNEPCVAVTAGQTFVLNVSNFSSSQSGYTLSFAGSTAIIFDNVPPVFQSVNTPISCGATTLTFNFSENIKCNTVTAADFSLTGPGGPYTITNVSGAACASGAPMENTFTVTVSPAITTSGTYSICLTNTANTVADNCNNLATPACFAFNVTGVTSTTSQVNESCPGAANGSATISASGGSGYSYLWSNGATTATASGLTAATYTYTVTASNGCASTGSVTITTLNPTPTVTVSPATPAICQGGSVNLTASGATTYSWSPATGLSPTTGAVVTASPATTTTYTVVGTGPGGCTASTSVTVTVNPLPTVNVSASPATICSGSSSTLTAAASGGSGGYTYSWASSPAGFTSTSASPSVSPTVTTNYTVTVTDASGCTATGSVTINVIPPVVLAPTASPATICSGGNSVLSASASGGNGSYTYSWTSSPAGFSSTSANPTVSPTITTTYTVTATSGVCSSTQSVTVTVVPPIVVNPFASPANICQGSTSVLTAGASGGSGSYTYAWTSNPAGFTSTSGTPTVSPSVNTTYTVVVSSGGCSQTGTVNVTVTPAVTANPTATPASICAGLSTSLNAGAAGGTGTYSYNWTSNPAGFTSTAANGSHSPTVTTTYTVAVNSGLCSATASTTVTVLPQPTAVISGQDTICVGGTGNLTITLTGAGPWTITYTDGSASNTVTANASPYSLSLSSAGTYTLVSVSDANCTGTVSGTGTIIQMTPITVSAVNPVCDPSGVDYTVSFTISGGNPAGYNVNPSGTLSGNSFTSNPIPSGSTYTFTVSDGTGCPPETVSGTHTCSCPATATLNGGGAMCPGDSIPLTVTLAGTAPWSIVWANGATSGTTGNIPASPFTFYATSAGTYSLTSVSDANCTGSASGSAVVSLLTIPTASISGGGLACPADSVSLTFNFTGTGP